jgi:hypothetical protein
VLVANSFAAFIASNSTYKDDVVCYKITCSEESDVCAYTDSDQVLYLNDGECKNDELCSYT